MYLVDFYKYAKDAHFTEGVLPKFGLLYRESHNGPHPITTVDLFAKDWVLYPMEQRGEVWVQLPMKLASLDDLKFARPVTEEPPGEPCLAVNVGDVRQVLDGVNTIDVDFTDLCQKYLCCSTDWVYATINGRIPSIVQQYRGLVGNIEHVTNLTVESEENND